MFVLNDVLCDLVVSAEMMEASACCAVRLLSSPGDEILLFTRVSQKAAAALPLGYQICSELPKIKPREMILKA